MGTATIAPPLTGADIGSKIAEIGSKASEIGSKVGSQLGKVGVGALRVGGVGFAAIFASQSVGVGSDQIPGVTAGLPSDEGLYNPGIMMGDKAQTKPQARVDEKDITCTADNPNCKENHLHRGVIQAQEAKGMLVIVPAGHNWFTKHPPSFARVAGSLTIVRAALEAQRPKVSSNSALKLIGGDRGNSFQANADVAAANLLKYLEKNKTNGISAVVNRSFYFNGSQGNGKRGPTSGPESRRIDIDIELGSIMGNKSI